MRLSRRFVGFAVLLMLLGSLSFAGPVSAGQADAGKDYFSTLSSGEEVPVAEQDALGWAWFHINDDGNSLSWVLWISAINDPIAAHIHVGGKGINGPVVLPLYAGKDAGAVSGTMSTGTATAKDLTGPLQGKSMDDLFTAMKNGGAYANVHSVKYPGGQTRGQIHTIDPTSTAYGIIG